MRLWDMRWHIARLLIRLAFLVAPRGAARDRYYLCLLDASRDIITHPRDQITKERT